MLKRIEWKHKLRPKALRQEIVWNLASPTSRGSVVDDIYERYPECHRRRNDPTCVQQDRLEIKNIIEPLDPQHPKFDDRKYGEIVITANTRRIQDVYYGLLFSLLKHVEIIHTILDDFSLPLETSKYILIEARAKLESVKALDKLTDAVLKFHRAIAFMDDSAALDAHQSVNRNVKPQANKLKNDPFDEKLIPMPDYVAIKQR